MIKVLSVWFRILNVNRSYIIERLMMSLDKSEDGNDFDEEFNLSSKWLGEVSSRIKDFDDNRVKLDSVVENIREKLGQMRGHRTVS